MKELQNIPELPVARDNDSGCNREGLLRGMWHDVFLERLDFSQLASATVWKESA